MCGSPCCCGVIIGVTVACLSGRKLKHYSCDTVIIGAGIVGVSTAYYLAKHAPDQRILVLDAGQPMAFTSAQSGENYRNWWPHPVMTAFTDRSIDLMEQLAGDSDNRINMNRRGYVLATRSDDVDQLMTELHTGYSELGGNAIRVHDNAAAKSYQPPLSPEWMRAPSGVDVLRDQRLIRKTFPSYDPRLQTVVHVRRAGAISGQQMGQIMLEHFRQAGGIRVAGRVQSIKTGDGFCLELADGSVTAGQLVNAAGPFVNTIASMLGTALPVTNTLQQKIAFEDTASAIPRAMPFSIDLDEQIIDWDEEETALLADDPQFAWLTEQMPGAIHCRPDGGDDGRWIKLGWAFNNTESQPVYEPQFADNFPEIVLRGAARLNPSLKAYYGRLPRTMHHYGGYYTLTKENWPLIGPMAAEGSYVVGAMSGFGTMAACAAGELCACWVAGAALPDYAAMLSPARYHNAALMAELNAMSSRGIL